jgi:tetratricopeptide (TPR) repeat protein
MPLSKSEREFHETTKKRCFNEAWEYLEKKNRKPHEDQRMLNLAHAARFHAGIIGTPRNHAVGDWQISRVYAALHEPRLALEFAKSSLELCESNDLSDMIGTAYEAIARAYVVANDVTSASEYIGKARDRLDAAQLDAEDREVYLGQIRETERLIRQARARSSSG